jgi:hypothetical protein
MTDETTKRSEINFIVGSAGVNNEGSRTFDLSHELNLVKAALLYADHVKLISIGASLLYGFVDVSKVPHDQRLALIREHRPDLFSEKLWEDIDVVKRLGSPKRRRNLSGPQLAQLRRAEKGIQAAIDQGWEGLVRSAEENFEAYNARGLKDAVNSGVLDLHPFKTATVEAMISGTAENVARETQVEELFAEYVKEASIAIEGPGYPLFDTQIRLLVDVAVQQGLINPTPASVKQGRHGGLAGDLLGRLPLFEEADVAEVLDIRDALERHLRGFRRAVSEFAGEVQSAAWNEGFAGEAELLFREKVEPEVQHIEEAVRENSSYAKLGRRALSPPAIGVVVGAAQNLPVLTSLVMGLGTSGVSALVAQQERLREIRDNQLYFYYGARQMLDRPEQR